MLIVDMLIKLLFSPPLADMKLSLLIPGLLAAAQASAVVGVNASQYTVDPKAPEAFFVDFHTDIDGDATFT